MKKFIIYFVVGIMILLSLVTLTGCSKSTNNNQETDNEIETASGESATKQELIGQWRPQVETNASITFNEDGTGELVDSEDEEYNFNYNVSTDVIDGLNTKYVIIDYNGNDKIDKIRYVISGDLLYLETENELYYNSMRRVKE